MRRFETETPEAVDLLSGVLWRELEEYGSFETLGVSSASEMAMDDGRDEKRRNGEARRLVGVDCSIG